MRFKILAVGNSFSDNALKFLYQILNSFGINEIVVGNLYIGGCSIDTHYSNAVNNVPSYIYRKNTTGSFVNYENSTILNALIDEDWDFITLQQVSGLSGIKESLDEKIDYLIDYIKKNVKNKTVKIGWHMTWAYEKTSTHPDFVKYQNSQQVMYDKIVTAVKENIVNKNGISFIIPAGTAIQNARTSYLGDTLTIDGFHLNELGEVISGLMYVKSITNWYLDLINWDLMPYKFNRYKEVIKEAVIRALEEPFSISNLNTVINPLLVKKSKFIEHKDISYDNNYPECKLDIYLPERAEFDTVIHFHGGGLASGSKDDYAHITMGKELAERGICFVSIGYRMYPKYKYPDFLIDATNAVQYVLNILKPKKGKIIISGQSAGAYIGMMLCFNKEYLINNDDIDGWLIEAGQPTTHFKLLEQDGKNPNIQCIDEKAPLFYINEETNFKNMCLITYTNDIPLRKEQNILLYEAIRQFNSNAKINLRILEGLHCVNSTTSFNDYYPYVDLIIEYLKAL